MQALDLNAARVVTPTQRWPRSRVIVHESRVYLFALDADRSPQLVASGSLTDCKPCRQTGGNTLTLDDGQVWQVRKLCSCQATPLPNFDWRSLAKAAQVPVA